MLLNVPVLKYINCIVYTSAGSNVAVLNALEMAIKNEQEQSGSIFEVYFLNKK